MTYPIKEVANKVLFTLFRVRDHQHAGPELLEQLKNEPKYKDLNGIDISNAVLYLKNMKYANYFASGVIAQPKGFDFNYITIIDKGVKYVKEEILG